MACKVGGEQRPWARRLSRRLAASTRATTRIVEAHPLSRWQRGRTPRRGRSSSVPGSGGRVGLLRECTRIPGLDADGQPLCRRRNSNVTTAKKARTASQSSVLDAGLSGAQLLNTDKDSRRQNPVIGNGELETAIGKTSSIEH
jgi:hypothetical protein